MKNFKSILAILTISMSLIACDDSSDSGKASDAGASQATAQLRAVHLSPDAPAVDIAVNNTKPLTGVTYRQASQFLDVATGKTNIRVLAAQTDTAVIDANLNLQKNMKYTVIAANTLANIAPIVITDDNAAPSAGKAAITIVHGAPSAPAVDIYVTAPGAALPVRSSATLRNVPFKAVSSELELAAGHYQVRITPANSRSVVYDSGSIELIDGVEYIAIAADDVDSSSLVGLTILTDLDDPAFVNVNNMMHK